MDKKESWELYMQGVDIWNSWAEEMLAQRTKLIEAEKETVKDDAKVGELRKSEAMKDWIAAAGSDFSMQSFENEANFANFVFPGDVNFTEASFSDDAGFVKVIFSGETWFHKTTFSGDAKFEQAMFSGGAKFLNTTFSGDADFEKVTFNASVTFHRVKFSGYADFSEAKFTAHAGFSLTSFENFAIFTKANFQEANFIGITAQSFFKLDGAVFSLVPDFLQAHFREAPRLDSVHFGDKNHKYINLTQRWRTLRRLAVQGHDHDRELNFLAEEIKSLRRVQTRFLPGGRYWMGLLYQLFSDFGRSVGRPFIWWGVVTMGFLLYYLSHHPDFDIKKLSSIASLTCSGDSVTANPMKSALYLSLHNGLVISGLSRTEILAQSYACLYGREGKDGLSPIMPYAVVFASLGQTILSALLIFLFLLGLRNYFRIK